MKSKTIAIAVASVLVSPLVLANPSRVSADGRGGKAAAAPSSRTNLEAEMRFRGTNVKAEAEVEFGQGTVNSVAKTKLGAEVEIVLVNPATPPDATSIDASIHVEATAVCIFTNDPRVTGPITVGAQTLYKVEFQGSVSQSGVDPIVAKGLDCGATIPAVVLGDTAAADITGLPAGTTVPTLTGKFVND
jgi:hypothetical protein